MRQHVRGVWDRVGRRGDCLLFLALVDFGFALYLFVPPPGELAPVFAFAHRLAPLWVFGLLWFVVGVACLVGAFADKRRYRDEWAFTAAVGIKVLWSVIILLGWVIGHLDYGWFSAIIWLVFARLVFRISTWPEPQMIDPATRTERDG